MLKLRDVSVRFGDRVAVEGVDLEVREGEQFSILGPSGSGKSTLLRAIAGLEPLARGRVEWNGRDLANVPVHRRGFGLMFQDYALFPHLDVTANVGFGLSGGAGMAAAERSWRVAQALDLVGLRGYEKRLPAELSGGEQQRVALARALAPQPLLLMLDEPLGALDRSLRRALLEQLAEIFARLNTPIIYVTHDHEEALAVGDRVAVMRAGRIETVMPPAKLWQRPPSEFVARFLGFTNVFDAEIAGGRAQTALGTFQLASGEQQIVGSSVDGNWKLLLRPDAFRAAPDGALEGVVRSATFRGDHTLLHVDVRGDGQSDARLDIQARWLPVPAVGERVRLAVDPAGVVLLR